MLRKAKDDNNLELAEEALYETGAEIRHVHKQQIYAYVPIEKLLILAEVERIQRIEIPEKDETD